MDVAHPTAGWEQLGECFYRKIQLYTQVFDQDLDLDNYLVAGAPYGGAIGEWMNACCAALCCVFHPNATAC
jgi:hypothetical protein